MTTVSIVAIYALFWVMTAFVVLPFGVRNNDELGFERLPGHDPGAPANFNPRRILAMTTLISAAFFGLYYANYSYGWIDRESFNWLYNPPS
jgi:predicted secreted protein